MRLTALVSTAAGVMAARRRRWRCWPAAVGLLAVLTSGSASAQWEVDTLRARFESGNLVLGARVSLALSNEAETALNRGIPLTLTADVRLYRTGWWPWWRKLGEWSIPGQIRYHALSGHFIVTRLGGGASDSFASLRDGLDWMGRVENLVLALPRDFDTNPERVRVDFRVRLDVSALPAPLQPLAYTSSAWRLKSDWTQWPSAQ